MTTPKKKRGQPLIATSRPDRTTVFVVDKSVAPQVIREVACGGTCGGSSSCSSWAGEVVCGGPVAQVAVSTTNAGHSLLGALLESGVLEIWDIAAPEGGLYTLREVVHLPAAASGEVNSSGSSTSSSGEGDKNASNSNSDALSDCLFAGSRGLPSGLFFFVTRGIGGKSGGSSELSRLHVVRIHPSTGPPTVGTQRLTAMDASRKKVAVVALTCHESQPLLCVGFQDGVLHLYDVGGVAAEKGRAGVEDNVISATARSYVPDGSSKQENRDFGDDNNDNDDGQEQASGIATTGKAAMSVLLGRSVRNLLLPVAALKFGIHMQGALSCICMTSEFGIILAGSTRGEVAVWSTNTLLRETAQGENGSDDALNLSGAVLPLQSCEVMAMPSPIERIELLKCSKPLILVSVRAANGDSDVTRVALLAFLPKSLVVVHMGPPVRTRHLAFQSRNSCIILSGEGNKVNKLLVSKLADVLACPAFPLPSQLAAIGPPQLDCGAFLADSWGCSQPSSSPSSPTHAPFIYSIQSRMLLSLHQDDTNSFSASRKSGLSSVCGSLTLKALVVARPLHHLQNKRSSDRDKDIQAEAVLLLPTYGKDFSVLLDRLSLSHSVPIFSGLNEDNDQILLLPHRLIVSPDGSLIVVLLRILRPKVAGSDNVVDACAPLAYVVVRQSSTAQDGGSVETNNGNQVALVSLDFVHAGVTIDAAFLSPRILALLQSYTGKCGAVVKTTLLQANGDPSAATTAWVMSQTVEDGDVQTEDGAQEYIPTRLFRAGGSGFPYEGEGSLRVLCVRQQRQAGGNGSTILTCSRIGGGFPPSFVGSAVLRAQEVIMEAINQTSNGQGIEAGSVIAVLTSQRLLLFSPDLTLLAGVELTMAPCGLAWLGPTPLIVFADGRVLYLSLDSGATELRPVLSLDQEQAGADVILVAALPDRLVYAANNGASGSLRIFTRALLPLEPLLVGFLAWPRLVKLPVISFAPSALYSPSPPPPSAVEAVTSSPFLTVALKTLLELYGPLAKQRGARYALGEGPSVDAGATAWACAALSRAGFGGWAAALAGVAGTVQLGKGRESKTALLAGQSEGPKAFQPRPWIPPEVKAGLAAQNSQWQDAMCEAMGDNIVKGQDVALHSDITLPPRFRHRSRVLALLGQRAWQAGQTEEAFRLFDLAGEDENAMNLLILHLLGGGPVSDGCAQLLRDLCKAEPHLLACLREGEAFMTKEVGPEKKRKAAVASLVCARLSLQTFPFDYQRRQYLLPRLSGAILQLPQWPQAGLAPSTTAFVAFPATPSSSSSSVSRGGPPRAPLVQALLLDRVEEWLGRVAPEGLREEISRLDERERDATKREEEWVKGVGEGREEDNVVLYLRFNEPTFLADSSMAVEVPLRMAGDLSQYGHSLDLANGQSESLSFVKSTCPIDQGDDVKVRMGMDAFWGTSNIPYGSLSSSLLPRGLRAVVARGSALDVGPYHGPQEQPGRCRLTVELWIQRSSSSSSYCSSQPEVLITRKTIDEQSMYLWGLGISAEGALIFWTEGKQAPLSTVPGTVMEGIWTHVAFTLEMKSSGGKQATVAFFVGGKKAISTQSLIKFPFLSESQLRRTVLEVGPNLRGHRMTELRLWACARSADDLYDYRESYLQLAEKRKKLAFRIKSDGGRSIRNEGSDIQEAAPTSPPPLPVKAARKRENFAPLPNMADGVMFPVRRRGAGREDTSSITLLDGLRGLSGEGACSLIASLPAPTANDTAVRRWQSRANSLARSADGLVIQSSPPPTHPSVDIDTGWAGFKEDPVSRPTSFVVTTTAPLAAAEHAPPTLGLQMVSTPPELKHLLLLLPSELDVNPANVLRDEIAGYFSQCGQYLCLREMTRFTNLESGIPKVAIVVLAVTTSADQLARRDRYPFQAKSAILVGGLSSSSSSSSLPFLLSSPVIACYTVAKTTTTTTGGRIKQPQAGVLQVYDLMQRRGVARQPVQTRVLFWRWISRGVIALVTPRAVFLWTVGVKSGPSGVPTKTFDRRDLTLLGPNANVRDYHHAAGGEWGVLTTVDGDGARLAVQFHDIRSGKVIVESGTELISANVGKCDGGVDQGNRRSQTYFVMLRRCPELTVDLCVEEGKGNEQGMCNPRLVRLARLPLPSAPASLSDSWRAWVLFPPGRTDIIVLLFSAGGLLYTCCSATHRIEARGSVFPEEQAGAVLDVSWDVVSGDMLVLEAERLAVFRVSNL
ncbi:Hypothetical protein NocV09_00301590 [Nannochloropsis oceanica]